MASRVDVFFELLEDESEIFRQYLSRRKKWGAAPVFVFEGEDEKYYSSAISTIFAGDWHTFIAGRKSQVLQLRADIRVNAQLAEDMCFFFVDRDYLNDVASDWDLYVTPSHSIENLYCTSHAVRSLFRGECGLAREDKNGVSNEAVLDWIMDVYNAARSQYLGAKAVRQFNLLLSIYCGRQMQDTLNLNNNLKMTVDFLRQEGEKFAVAIHYSATKDLKAAIQKNTPLTRSELFAYRKDIRNYFDRDTCRGKQELYFLFRFVESVKAGVLTEFIREKFSKRIKMNFFGSATDLISYAAQYAEKPASLIKFLCAIPGSRFLV